MADRDRDIQGSARTPRRQTTVRTPRRRIRRGRAIVGLTAVLALAAPATSTAAAAPQSGIPGYNQAQVDKAISAVGKASTALQKALHPGHRPKHRPKHQPKRPHRQR